MSKLTRIEEAKDPECFLDFLYMKKTRHGQNIYYLLVVNMLNPNSDSLICDMKLEIETDHQNLRLG